MRHHTIQKLRITLGLTQAQLAELVGLTRAQLSRIETGRRPASAGELARLASVLDVPPDCVQQAPCEVSDLLRPFRREYPRLDPGPHTGETRLGAVRMRFPQLWPLLEPVAHREVNFLRQIPSDSAGETCLHLLELARGAKPVEVQLGRVGFDLWPVVDGLDGRCTINYRRWALATDDWLLVPQVTILARRRYRLDALVVARRPRRGFINLEIDGPGHDARFDKERQLTIGLPQLRVMEEEFVTYPGLSALLLKRAAA